jgi:hypothetical protein
MRIIGLFLFGIVAAVGVSLGYIAYHHAHTSIVLLDGAPQVAAAADGEMCGDQYLIVDERTLGRWYLELPENAQLTATVTAGQDASHDIGLSIWSPSNQMVWVAEHRAHVLNIELTAELRGGYRFDFENRHSTFTPKALDVSFCYR